MDEQLDKQAKVIWTSKKRAWVCHADDLAAQALKREGQVEDQTKALE